MKILPFKEIDPSAWNRACEGSDLAWFYDRYEWITMEAKYFCEKNLSFALADNKNNIIGLVPLYIYSLGLGAWVEKLIANGLHRHSGVILLPSLDKNSLKHARTTIIEQIFYYAKENNLDRIQLAQQTLAPGILHTNKYQMPFWILDKGFHFGINVGPLGILPIPFMSTCAVDQVIILDKTKEELFNQLDPACRQAIRKSLTYNLTFKEVERKDCAKIAYELAQISAKRTNQTVQEKEYYEDLFTQLLPQHIQMFTVSLSDEIIASIVILIDKGAASGLLGSSNPHYLHTKCNDFLHWSMLLWLKEQGAQAYRLGHFFPSLPNEWPVSKISKFKTKFGADSIPISQGSYFLKPENYLRQGIKFLEERLNSKG